MMAVGILRVDDGHRNPRVAAHVLILLTSLGGVENDMFAVKVAPHRRNLRPAIGHKRAQTAESALLKQIAILLGDNIGHKASLRVVQ